MTTLAALQLNPTIGAIEQNTDNILKGVKEARQAGATLIVTHELAIPGYPPDDLLLIPTFVRDCHKALLRIRDASDGCTIVVGTIRTNDGLGKPLFNTAAICQNGKIIGYQDKTLLPTYDVFDELRYFEPATSWQPFECDGQKVSITICEDIWNKQSPALLRHAKHKPDLHINLTASPYSLDKLAFRHNALCFAAQKIGAPSLLVNQVGGNDSLIFDGNSEYVSAEGKLLVQGKGFEPDIMMCQGEPRPLHLEPIPDLCKALTLGLRDYLHKSGFGKALIALSGGIDSALVVTLACRALGPKNVLAVCMPSRYSSESSLSDSKALTDNLGIESITIPIEEPLHAFEKTLSPHFHGKPVDVTEENLQARIRGTIAMSLANKHGYIVLATGNKSESAVGYATLYGDMCGGLSVINDVTKQQVYALCRYINSFCPTIPESIITKAPSAELRPDQKDSDVLPDYAILDSVLEAYVEKHLPPEQIATSLGLAPDLVLHIVKMIHRAEFKRRQAPPGLRVTEKAFSIGRRIPIVQGWIY